MFKNKSKLKKKNSYKLVIAYHYKIWKTIFCKINVDIELYKTNIKINIW